MFEGFLVKFLEVAAALFIFFVGSLLLLVIVLYFIDRGQTGNAIRRNYPVIGRFRYLFQHLGEFFRQYFFAMDREELPFNRAQRTWVYRAARNADSTVAFGSTRELNQPGTVLFVNCPYPTLDEDAVSPQPLIIGPQAKKPYEATSLVNVSGMSYGALSSPAVLALSKGAKLVGCWMNTGEGGLSPSHLKGGADIVFQIGTAKYGVRDMDGNLDDEKLRTVAANDQVKMFEIKLSQGAKPGKGGILPGKKVTEEIAGIRGIRAGEDSISPNRHRDIGNVNDLLAMINRVRDVTGRPVGFKMVLGARYWLDDLFTAIRRKALRKRRILSLWTALKAAPERRLFH